METSVRAMTIKEYFKGKTIFLTGGSGFVGKVLIEKLLRSTEVGKIYTLLRTKKGKTTEERIKDIFDSPLFKLLKDTKPEALKKVIGIEGDITQLNLALSNDIRELLKNEVNIVFHAAASVRFDDIINDAVICNIRSVREIATFVLEMKNLEVFQHVSTAYCNIDDRISVEEKLYPAVIHWREAIELAEKYDRETFNILTQKYIGDFPNTYTFTKRLAEHCVNDMLVGKVPTIICRPSIVISTLNEPFQGFTDNLNGPTATFMATSLGILRSTWANEDVNPDYINCDSVVALMIMSTWKKAMEKSNDKLSIYHASNNLLTKFRYKDIWILESLFRDYPYEKKIWFPDMIITKCWYYYFIATIILQLIPAIMLDGLMKLLGKKPLFFKVQRKIYVAIITYVRFWHTEFQFVNDNGIKLIDLVPEQEREEFRFEMLPNKHEKNLEFFTACSEYWRRNFLKEDWDVKAKTKRTATIMYCLHKIVKKLFLAWILWKVCVTYNILGVVSSYLYQRAESLTNGIMDFSINSK